MAAFNRLTEATYEIHESVKVDTQDNEDHTFCGVMFPIKCKELLPLDHISIRSIAVRGQLGPMTVWVSKLPDEVPQRRRTPQENPGTTVFLLSPSHWHKVYEKVHQPSSDTYDTLELDAPIIMKPGQIRAIYIHSTLPGDQAIVYDNAHDHHFGRQQHRNNSRPRYEDPMISIYTGRAHVSNTPFGTMAIWGWGNPWRDHREFVGQLHYGAVYQLWNPPLVHEFGPKFREALFNLKLCQTRWESPISRLPDECLYYILNMCRWDWFEDTPALMTQQKQQRKQLEAEQKMEAAKAVPDDSAAAAPPNEATASNPQQTAASSCGGCCSKTSTDNNDDEDDESDADYEDAVEDILDDDDDDDDDEDVVEEELEAMEDEDYEDDDSESWERDNGYRPNQNVFRFVDPDMQEPEQEDEEEDGEGMSRQDWIRRSFQRIHILRALARQQDDDEEVVDMNLVF